MSFAARLKELRTKTNKSLNQVADEVGSSKAHIWDLETGRAKNPSIELVKKLADCFRVSVADLIGENPPGEGDEPELVAMFRDLKDLTPEDRDAIKTMMTHLKKRGS